MKTSRVSALGLVAALVLPSVAFAVQPPPGGGYPNDVTALGDEALAQDNPGADNTGIGFEALQSVTTSGVENTAVGSHALTSTTSGGANVAIGFYSLFNDTTGNFNIAVGYNSLVANTTGVYNVAIGNAALQDHATGNENVAVGAGALSQGSSGTYNVAVGSNAMAFSGGEDNVGVGPGALNMASGSFNVGIGQDAGTNLSGNSNVAIGPYAGQNVTSGANNIDIGNQGAKKDNALIRIGTVGTQNQTFIAGISGTTVPKGVAVMIDSKGQLGVATSSARFKDDIQPMKDASDVLLSLQPVTFRYKKELDSLGTPQFGLVAEQVAKVDPDLVARDESGKPYTVRYEAVNAMLLNEFLKEHRKVEQLEATVSELKAAAAREASLETTVGELKAALKQQAAQIQKVSARDQDGRTASRLISAND
jgi:hypothetical protein